MVMDTLNNPKESSFGDDHGGAGGADEESQALVQPGKGTLKWISPTQIRTLRLPALLLELHVPVFIWQPELTGSGFRLGWSTDNTATASQVDAVTAEGLSTMARFDVSGIYLLDDPPMCPLSRTIRALGQEVVGSETSTGIVLWQALLQAYFLASKRLVVENDGSLTLRVDHNMSESVLSQEEGDSSGDGAPVVCGVSKRARLASGEPLPISDPLHSAGTHTNTSSMALATLPRQRCASGMYSSHDSRRIGLGTTADLLQLLEQIQASRQQLVMETPHPPVGSLARHYVYLALCRDTYSLFVATGFGQPQETVRFTPYERRDFEAALPPEVLSPAVVDAMVDPPPLWASVAVIEELSTADLARTVQQQWKQAVRIARRDYEQVHRESRMRGTASQPDTPMESGAKRGTASEAPGPRSLSLRRNHVLLEASLKFIQSGIKAGRLIAHRQRRAGALFRQLHHHGHHREIAPSETLALTSS